MSHESRLGGWAEVSTLQKQEKKTPKKQKPKDKKSLELECGLSESKV